MTLDAAEFIRRFLLHVLPSGVHRIRHYGLLAGAVRARNIERARQLLAASTPESAQTEADDETETPSPARRCPCCGGRMIVIETFEGVRPAFITNALKLFIWDSQGYAFRIESALVPRGDARARILRPELMLADIVGMGIFRRARCIALGQSATN